MTPNMDANYRTSENELGNLDPVADYDYADDMEASRLIAEGPRLTYDWNRVRARSPADLLSSYGTSENFEKIVGEDVSDVPEMRDGLMQRDAGDADPGGST